MRSEDYQRLIQLSRSGDASAARRLDAEARRRDDLPNRLLAQLVFADADALCDLFDAIPSGPRLDGLIDLAVSAHPDLDLCAYAWQEALLDGSPNPRLRLASSLFINRHSLRRAHLRHLAHAADLPRLRSLTFAKNTHIDDLSPLLNSPLSERLEALDLRYAPITDAHITSLTRGPWPRLAKLEVVEGSVSSPSLTALAHNFSHFPALRSLSFVNNRLGNAALITLAASPLLSQLRTLHLVETEIQGGGALASLLSSPHLPPPDALALSFAHNPLLLDDIEALLCSPHAPDHLTLRALRLDAADLRPRLPRLPLTRVRHLILSKTTADAAALQALLDAPDADRLDAFEAHQCDLTPDALLPLLPLPRLTRLTLRDCHLTDAHAFTLARASISPSLRRLALPHNHLTDASARALLDAPWLPQLTDLDLSHNPLTALALTPLTLSAPNPDSLRLDLSGCPIGDVGAVTLALSPAMASARLFCWGCGISAWGARALRLSPFLANAPDLDLGGAPLPQPPLDRVKQSTRLICTLQRVSKLILTAPPHALIEDLSSAWLTLSRHSNPGRALSDWLLDRPEVEDLFGDDDALSFAIRDARRTDPSLPLAPADHLDAILCQAATTLLSLLRRADLSLQDPYDLLPLARDLSAAWLSIAFSYTPGDALLSWLLAHPRAPTVSPACDPSSLRDLIAEMSHL
jgi:hypothetical protein